MEEKKSGIKKFFEEFKAFAMRGNVLDMAVGVVIGGAFTAIVTALVEDIINPLIGLFFTAVFYTRKMKGAILYGILLTWILGRRLGNGRPGTAPGGSDRWRHRRR